MSLDPQNATLFGRGRSFCEHWGRGRQAKYLGKPQIFYTYLFSVVYNGLQLCVFHVSKLRVGLFITAFPGLSVVSLSSALLSRGVWPPSVFSLSCDARRLSPGCGSWTTC